MISQVTVSIIVVHKLRRVIGSRGTCYYLYKRKSANYEIYNEEL